MSTAVTVAQIFGIAKDGKVPEVGDLVKNFDFSKVSNT